MTANLRHFLAPYGIEVLHPDEFVLRLIERVPARACWLRRVITD